MIKFSNLARDLRDEVREGLFFIAGQYGQVCERCFFITGQCGHGSPCEQLCYELHDGMYECDCKAGFLLREDGYSCYGEYPESIF